MVRWCLTVKANTNKYQYADRFKYDASFVGKLFTE